MRSIEVRELVAIEVEVDGLVDLGGGRRFIPFVGGTFAGRDGLAGRVAPGGVDWQQARPDGTLEIDAHYALVTSENEVIEVRSTGLRVAAPEVLERLARGDAVAPEEYYFRTHIRLRTASTRLAWLNDLLAISTGRRERNVVHIHVHEVL